MNSIKIQKIGITDLDTDAIVNAANDGLWAGGGVCGVIFQVYSACHQWYQWYSTDGSFMSRKEAVLLGLGGSTLLVGKK